MKFISVSAVLALAAGAFAVNKVGTATEFVVGDTVRLPFIS